MKRAPWSAGITVMAGVHFSSGDSAADRRAEFAEALVCEADFDGAIETLRGALDLAPAWAAGWYRLGEVYELAGAMAAAVEAYDRAAALDPADPFGAGLKRALLLNAPVTESMPPAFVELLFDQYAPRFEKALVGGLNYRGPAVLMEALRRDGFAFAASAMDLGCGTGLMGEVLRPACARLEGLDLSAGMLRQARAKGIYDQLDKADIAALELSAKRFDLIVAADVFIYLGALERVVGWCAGSLLPGGRLAFTVERCEDGDIALRETRRFAHSRDYLEGLLSLAGFSHISLMDCVLRTDQGRDVAALCVTARAPRQPSQQVMDGEDEAAA